MLNETWRLRQALERSDFMLARKHKRVQTPGRTFPCLRVCLNRDSKISTIQDIGNDEWLLWTVMEGNKNSFPVVRVQEPLFHIESGHKVWTNLGYDDNGNRRNLPTNQKRIKILEDILRDVETPALSKKAHNFWKRLRDQKAKELADCVKNDDLQMKAVALLAGRFTKAAKEPETLLKLMAVQAVLRLRQGRLMSIDSVEQLLVGKASKRGKRPGITVQLAFDIDETEGCTPRLYSLSVRNRLIQTLPQDPFWSRSSGDRDRIKRTGIDALTGETAKIENKTFPQVDLPVPSARRGKSIGRKRFPLASMFSKAHCNTRYGMTNARVFPVAQTRAIHLKEALEEITADARREKNWQHVASGRFDTQQGRKIEKPDLLIAYVEEKPMLDAKTASFFGQSQSVIEAKFEVDSAVVCKAFRGIANKMPNSKLNLFLIREVSKGQAQVVLSESPTLREVLERVEQWKWAARHNVPPITMDLPAETRNGKLLPEVKKEGPPVPYPDQVVRLLSSQWVRDGSSSIGANGKRQKAKQEIVGPGFGEVLDLMFRKEGKWEPAAKRMLNLLIHRVMPLIIGLFGAKHHGPRQKQGKHDSPGNEGIQEQDKKGLRKKQRKHEPLSDYPRESRETALQAVAVFGILLDTLESRKERYMSYAPFLVGQVLALADILHKDYCDVVRKGQLPNSLIGTSLMRRALDSPVGALADLGERMMEYVRWAKVAQVSHDWPQNDPRRIAVNEARKKLRQYQYLANTLGTCDLPAECNDLMKAQLLLGFLATPPVEAKNDEREDEGGE